MPRRKRNWLDRSCYHITHRCIDKQYFFEDTITRDTYIKELREMIGRYKVDILNYVVTCNHIHLLVYASKGTEIEKGMQYLQGRMGQRYNMLKERQGAFWSGRYHATLIEKGSHLSRCLFYIDYNMMRAGAVNHPSEWKQSGYHELIGAKQRYTIINQKKLLRCLGMRGEKENFLKWYSNTIEEKSKQYMERQSYWTEALAVGDESWINNIKVKIGKKRLTIVKPQTTKKYSLKETNPEYSVHEKQAPYAIY